MAAKQRILIVEDNLDFRPLLEIGCKLALDKFIRLLHELFERLPEDGFYVIDEPARTDQILLAADESQARSLLMSHSGLDFVSIDLALTEGEYGLDTSGRNPTIGVGGMRLLKDLHDINKRTLAMVVSGEKEPMYPVEATLKHKVISYLQKAHFDVNDYSQIVTAALLYQEALDYIIDVETLNIDPDNLRIAQQCWERAKQVVAEIPVNFPEDLGLRIEVCAKTLDRTTRRPTGEWINHALIKQVIGKYDWTMLRVQLTNFERFREEYTEEVDALRLLVAGAIKTVVKRTDDLNAFVGVLGAEYLPEPCFIVILSAKEEHQLQEMIDSIVVEYRKHNLALLPYRRRDAFIKQQVHQDASPKVREEIQEQLQQFLPQLKITYWNCSAPTDPNPFLDTQQAMYALTRAKHGEMSK